MKTSTLLSISLIALTIPSAICFGDVLTVKESSAVSVGVHGDRLSLRITGEIQYDDEPMVNIKSIDISARKQSLGVNACKDLAVAAASQKGALAIHLPSETKENDSAQTGHVLYFDLDKSEDGGFWCTFYPRN